MKKLLVLCDDPAGQTGFARVAQNVLKRVYAAGIFNDIWVWAVGYQGWPHELPYKLCPAEQPKLGGWNSPGNLRRFLALLEDGFTHVWLFQDTFALAPMAYAFAKLCKRRRIKSALYYPVDAPLETAWTRIIAAVDLPVAYCQYGLKESHRALALPMEEEIDFAPEKESADILKKVFWNSHRRAAGTKLISIPHGVDMTIYRPLPQLQRLEARKKYFDGKVTGSDFLLLNVSTHQKRKGLLQTLLTFKALLELLPGHSLKLAMHMPARSIHEEINLRTIAHQLGLSERDVLFADRFFTPASRPMDECRVNEIYNAANLLVTTSYGEGWGLPLTEAMAAGLPVAGPRHTNIAELLDKGRGVIFGTDGFDLLTHDNSRLRPRTDVSDAATKIAEAIDAQPGHENSLAVMARRGMEWTNSNFLNWDRIVDKWKEVFFAK